jgi:hypothetical protein
MTMAIMSAYALPKTIAKPGWASKVSFQMAVTVAGIPVATRMPIRGANHFNGTELQNLSILEES